MAAEVATSKASTLDLPVTGGRVWFVRSGPLTIRRTAGLLRVEGGRLVVDGDDGTRLLTIGRGAVRRVRPWKIWTGRVRIDFDGGQRVILASRPPWLSYLIGVGGAMASTELGLHFKVHGEYVWSNVALSIAALALACYVAIGTSAKAGHRATAFVQHWLESGE